MKKMLLIALLLVGLSACNKQKTDQVAEAQKLMQLSREWAAIASTNDLEKTLSYWATDALILTPGQPAIKGHEAIRKMLEGNANIPGFEISWEPKEAYVSKCGDMGYVIAHNQIKMLDAEGKQISIFNKGVEIWKKQNDGTWKNVVDVFNEDPTITSIR